MAYVKRFIEKAGNGVSQKIKKAETARKHRLNQPSDTSIRNPEPVVNSSSPKNSDRDSDGHQLSAAQQEFFEDSTVRDADGNLLVVYHGTPNGGFTTFRFGTYFTQNPEYAALYQKPGASMLSIKKNADNPQNYQVYLRNL